MWILCIVLLHGFYKSKVCGNIVSSKSTGIISPIACSHFMSLHHIFLILAIFKFFSLLLCFLWCSVISDLWRFTVIVLGSQEPCLYMTANLINIVRVPTALSTGHYPVSLPLHCTSWDTTILKLIQFITLQWPRSVQVKGRVAWLSL